MFNLLSLANQLQEKYHSLIKEAYIRKTPSGKWKVLSEKGKTLGEYKTKDEAVKRLRQIEYFKHHPKKKSASIEDNAIDLSHLKELSYSGIMRELRKQCSDEVVREFLHLYKTIFDAIVANGEENPGDKAMPAAILMFSKTHSLKLKHEDQKNA
jgi:hypothetical protein